MLTGDEARRKCIQMGLIQRMLLMQHTCTRILECGLSKVEAAWCATHLTLRTRTIDRANQLSYRKGRPVARGGGRGGRTTPPVAHPKDFVPPFSNFVPPFSNFVPPFSNFVPPFSNFVPPFSNFVPPFSNFVPPFSNFVPPLEYVDDVTRAMSKGGVLVNVQEWGAFFKLMTSRGQCPRGGVLVNVQGGGGCAWRSTHPSSDPPPPGWLATGLKGLGGWVGNRCSTTTCSN